MILKLALSFGARGAGQESLGPLERLLPSDEKLPGLMAVHGNPRLGLPSAVGERVERIGKGDVWCLETSRQLAVIGLHSETSQPEVREILPGIDPEWCLSPDGGRLFATRRFSRNLRPCAECFDFISGKVLWTMQESWGISDVRFSPDGTQLVTLHALRGENSEQTPAVSWHDAATGKLLRQVKLPGKLNVVSGAIGTDYLAVTDKAVHVMVPRDNDVPDGWTLAPGNDVPVKIALDESPSGELAQVQVGGARRELVAVYNEDVVELFREENGKLQPIRRVDVSTERGGGSYRKCVRFSPDHRDLLVSDYEKTVLIPTAGDAEIRRLAAGFRLGDYTADGKAFISFDDGGGALRELATMKRADRLQLREVPAHCCPITEAGFSTAGRWMISSDKHRLLLWSKDGELLAELASPHEERQPCLELQSPIVVEKLLKVYAGDGWDFLEWDLNEIAERRRKLPGIYPKVVGKVVFRDGVKPLQDPQVMNLALDSTGTKLLTASRLIFRYRPLEAPHEGVDLQVPRRDIFMRPRSVHFSVDDPAIVVRTGSEAFALDPSGKGQPTRVTDYAAGVDMKNKRFFTPDGLRLSRKPFGEGQTPDETMELPAEWTQHRYEQMLVEPEGRWLALTHASTMSLPSLAVIDWKEKKVVRDFALPWTASSLSLSPDGTRLLVGSSNRAIYVFDTAILREPKAN